MGVLICSRNGCENILCDRYSDYHGYICNECFDELIILGAETNIEKFLELRKEPTNEKAALARFNVEFPLRDDN